ncbi:MAG: proton-conducting transporter membrane subunit, partial [Candidatus Zixiibacteriota bacterium]
VLALFMFALAGFPATIGFIGKFYIFSSAVKQGFIYLAVIGVLNSFVSVYYYLRVVKAVYFEEGPAHPQVVPLSLSAMTAIVIAAIGTVGFGLFPHQILQMSRQAIFAFL